MKRHVILLFLFGIMILGIPLRSQTVQSVSQGFSVHVHGQFARWNSNSHFLSDISGEDPGGIGFGAEVRYGFTNSISGYLAFEGINFDTDDEWEKYNTTLYRFGGQYTFGGTTSKIRPIVHAGGVYQNFNLARIFINGTDPVDDAKLVSKGFAVEAGGGLMYYVIPEFSLSLIVTGQFGKYGSNFVNGRDYPFEETIDSQHLFVRLGAGYYFY
ncbi:hypothetical protein KUV50_09760 [Membranicola marinus]|uniref:Outer membrane protein beta-barrel domain-containing protein n=1 Tax=Membranihabitans marinus TaxID=1227546 RepID=A0A953HML9_9BACT|nr:hypothetical protein [Membranihabitans marinus]MBY5958417.1 hypothetical protein [Membranihabitans marinus]